MKAATWYMQNGWEIFFPLMTQTRCDFIATKGCEVHKVQVKTATESTVGSFNYLQCRLRRKGLTENYEPEDFTHLVIVAHDGRIWQAPYEDVAGLTSLCLGNNNPNNRNRRKTYDPDKWRVI